MKRFYETATVENNGVLLDGKALTSPAKHQLVLPNAALAQAIADEWNAQGTELDKTQLPLTGMASLALDIAVPRRGELVEELLEYGETDLLFYRSDDEELAAEQHRQWQPWINHAQVSFGTRYEVTDSIMPVAQPAENHEKHLAVLETLDHWQLALLAAVVKPTTSLILGWFFAQNKLGAEELFTLSRIEESHNLAKWGEDDEAKAKAESIRADLAASERWRSLL